MKRYFMILHAIMLELIYVCHYHWRQEKFLLSSGLFKPEREHYVYKHLCKKPDIGGLEVIDQEFAHRPVSITLSS